MRNVSFTIASLCLLLVVPQMTRAGDITYDIQNYPSDQVDYNTGSFDHSVSGTIMTDGTIGTLIATNILSWSVTFDNNPAETFQSTTLGYPSIYAISGLVATSSGSLTLGPGSNLVFYYANTNSYGTTSLSAGLDWYNASYNGSSLYQGAWNTTPYAKLKARSPEV